MHPVVYRSPLTKTRTMVLGTCVKFRHQYVRRAQPAPYNIPSEYVGVDNTYRQSRYDGYYPGSGMPGGAEAMSDVLWHPSHMVRVKNEAYERFRSRLTNQADLGITFAETSQAIAMFGRAAGTILRSMKAVKSLNFQAAASILKMHVAPPGVSRKKNWADNWLEYHFGWAPFMSTCYDAMETLNDPIKTFGMAKGASSDTVYHYAKYDLTSIEKWERRQAFYQAECGGRIKTITDRNLFTLNQWGLLNPAVVAWEIVPFSFVVDWFANVGNVLRSYSDFAGMELESTYTSFKLLSLISGSNRVKPGYAWQLPEWYSHSLSYSGRGVYLERNPTLWSPVLSLKTLRLPSTSRLATAAALITQIGSNRSSRGWVAYNTRR